MSSRSAPPELRSLACSGPFEATCEWAARHQSQGLWVGQHSCGGVQLLDLRRDRKCDPKPRPRSIRAVRRRNGSLHGFHEAAGNRETQSGSRPYAVGLPRPIELVKDMLQVAGRNAVTLVQDL